MPIRTLLLCSFVVAAIGAGLWPGTPASSQGGATRIYLPLVTRYTPTPFGVEVAGLENKAEADSITALGATWLRRNALSWRDVEPIEGGGYNWNAVNVQLLERDLLAANQNWLRPILIVHSSPAWATENGVNCAPIKPEKQQAFANFLTAAVARYSRPPYNVLYWEIGNEPDADIFTDDEVFGCWGKSNDEFYGGRAYGEMLRTVYPAIKQANRDVQVLNGGLLFDLPPPGNPRRPADLTTLPGYRFLRGIFAAGAGNSFDILNYHGYTFYDGTPDGSAGPVDEKVTLLRQAMNDAGLSKPLINTEGALLCVDPTDECRQAQADAVGRFHARALRNGLTGFIWYLYDSDGFRNTALVDPANPAQRRPAYAAYRHSAQMLAGATFEGTVAGLPAGVEALRFRRDNHTVIVFWSNQPQQLSLDVPFNVVTTCSDREANVISCPQSGGRVLVTAIRGPQYLIYSNS